jgi:tetratricopeptide (TPR) repeat protein
MALIEHALIDCLGIIKKDNYKRDCLSNLAYCFFKTNNYSEARRYWDIAISKSSDCDVQLLNILTNYCFMELKADNFISARDLLVRSENFINDYVGTKEQVHSLKFDIATHYRNKALFMNIDENYRESIELLLKSLDLLQQTPHKDEILSTCLEVFYSTARHSIKINSNIITEEELNRVLVLQKREGGLL